MNDVTKMRIVNDPVEMAFLRDHRGELGVPFSYPGPAGLYADADELRAWRKLRESQTQSKGEHE
jgi:hypothetical protein